MSNKEKYKKFFEDFNEKYPEFEIIEFKNLTSPIIFKDNEGVVHKKNIAHRCISHGIRKDSIINKEKYISDKLGIIHPDLKLIKFNGFKKRILVQDINGFQYNPICSDLLNGHPVSIQTCTEKEKLFIFKSNQKHNNLYEYLSFKYTNGKQKVKIKCKLHGVFEQMVESHLSGNGCKQCGYVGFSKESWMSRVKNNQALFYVLEVFNSEERFIKIGITSQSIEKRYKLLKDYKYKTLLELNKKPSFVYDLEKKTLKHFKLHKFHPTMKFSGKSECLDIKCLKELLQFLDKN